MTKNYYGKMPTFPSQASNDILQLPGNITIRLNTIKGKKWLNDPANCIFRYMAEEHSFTARKETSKTGEADYWYAYRKVEGKLHKRYIGKSEDLTGQRLSKVASALDTSPAPRQKKLRTVEDTQENYSTSVIRVPDAIKAEILFLIERFHKERKSNKSVADLKEPRSRYRQMHIEEFLDINSD